MIIARLKRGVHQHFEVRYSEWLLTALGLAVGAKLLRSPAMFEANAGYDFMARIANEWTWGEAVFFISVIRLAALVANGSFTGFRRFSPMARSLCAFAQSGVWFSIGIGIYVAAPYALLWVFCAALTPGELILSLMIAKPAGQALHHDRVIGGRP